MKDTIMNNTKWDFWVDRGGTFTDLVGQAPDGSIHPYKLLSENPESYKDAAIEGIRRLLGVEKNQKLPEDKIGAVKMGTTVAANALLERKGDPTALIITQGMGDMLKIGYQARPELFDKKINKPEQLYKQTYEVNERILANGKVEKKINKNEVRGILKKIKKQGIDSVAIVLMHAWKYPKHEKIIADIARKMKFGQVSVSHEVAPLAKLVGRGDTSVMDAYLSPILRRYVEQVRSEVGKKTNLLFMKSSGGLTTPNFFQGKDAVLSGPAGGVVGAVETSKLAGHKKIIGFDMGGTSTDVSHYDGIYERAFETVVDGVRIRTPMMNIHTVAAGGGSILQYDEGRLKVGPESAGANPGPACYRRGGPLTVTDANVMVGKIKPDNFPKIFGKNQNQKLDAEIVRKKFEVLKRKMKTKKSVSEIADGFLRIAVENMANAIKKISVQRGYDVTKYALTCFGGAAGQHACAVADNLGIKTVIIHPMSGLLSAYGMGLAHIRVNESKNIIKKFNKNEIKKLKVTKDKLTKDAVEQLREQGVKKNQAKVMVRVHLKYEGTDTALPVMFQAEQKMRKEFAREHKKQFGFVFDKQLIIDAIEIEAIGGGSVAKEKKFRVVKTTKKPSKTTNIFVGGKNTKAKVFERSQLTPGSQVKGPSLIIEDHQTIVVEDGWKAEINNLNHIIIKRVVPITKTKIGATKGVAKKNQPDPILLEIFGNLFMSIADQMGVALQNTASSVNIKERLDFSCAIFDHNAQLVANAPHMPAHLGSMDKSVETIIELNKGKIRPGDVYVLNAPYNGGTHLPDITVVTPVFDKKGKRIRFYVASRGHHADVGGMAPGSATPRATHVDEEGVLIDNFKMIDRGKFREKALYELLTNHKYPCRNPQENMGDLRAQVAANNKGVAEINNMIEQFGEATVKKYMKHVQDNAEESVRQLLGKLKNCSHTCTTDTGQKVVAKITVNKKKREATIDFTGTSPVQKNNFNAPFPITRAAVLYVFRVMVEKNIPLNSGCLKPIKIIVPDGCMLKPQYPAAVIAGNTETSQIVVNCLFMALGAMAESQGTMNNLTYGNKKYQNYETICSGAPAGKMNDGTGFDGADAVHTNMTNTRLTDPEILEMRFPVVVEEFSIKKGTGGKGKFLGGDGIKRTLRFTQPMTCAILSGYRKRPPNGLKGGGNGKKGKTEVRRLNGKIEMLEHCDETKLKAGEAVIVTPPTGGGYLPQTKKIKK